MHITLVEKSSQGFRLNVFDETLVILGSDSYKDSYTLNFHMQAIVKKHGIKKSILIIHDKEKNTVNLMLASEENSFFVG